MNNVTTIDAGLERLYAAVEKLPPPHFDDGGGRLVYHGDCRELLPLLEPGSVDLVLTDPPYGVDGAILNPKRKTNDRKHNTWFEKPEWDKEIDPLWCELCCRVSDVVAWFGNWKRRESVSSAMPHPIRCEIIWAKDTHVGPPCPAAMQDERIWIYSKNGLEPRCFETTVWQESTIPSWAHRNHRNEKPEPLMKRALRWLPGDFILDPFLGSGTTLRAAKDLGRYAIGIEIEERYCEISANRLRQEVLF